MRLETIELKFRTVTVPQLSKLPSGVHLVKQQPYSGQKHMGGKYAAFTKKGHLISLYAGNSLRAARKQALRVLNCRLLMVNLIHGDNVRKMQYKAAIPA